MTAAVIFDIDGTICDLSHRLHHVTRHPKNWNAFFDGVGDDAPHKEVVELAQILAGSGKKILLVSGRPERTREATVAWMAENGVTFECLYMRPNDDHRPDTAVKSQILDGILSDGYEIDFCVDDRPSIVSLWRERGLVCLQCRDWNEAPTASSGLLTLMVGPSGAGKTTWLQGDEAKALGVEQRHVISSDQIRQDLCGDFRDQTKNEEVFTAVHAVAKTRLRNGLPTVIDATNIRTADRLACVDLADGGPVRYIVIDRSMAEKNRDAGWRAEVVIKGKTLIEKHAETFGSNLKAILSGDGRPNVTTVRDLRAVT